MTRAQLLIALLLVSAAAAYLALYGAVPAYENPVLGKGLVEGAWVGVHGGLYLWYSGDACCGDEAHYAVMMARSESPFGPYARNPDNPILEANDMFDAPGHLSTVRGPDGNDWMIYHAIVRPDTTFRLLSLIALTGSTIGPWSTTRVGRRNARPRHPTIRDCPDCRSAAADGESTKRSTGAQREIRVGDQ